MSLSKWERNTSNGVEKFILRGDIFWISYNPCPGAIYASFASDTGGPETALCDGGDFFILNGDYRDSYEKLVPLGYAACKKFYDQQSAHADSSWSRK